MSTESPVYNIYYDAALDAVIMEWDGYATSQQFKEGTELMLQVLIKNNTSKVLADIKDMVLIGMEDQKWLENNFIPKAIEFGFKYIAMIRPDSYFNKVAVESVSYKIDREKLILNFYDNVEDAKAWLVAQ